MAKFGFDVSEVEASTGAGGGNYDPIPDGEYTIKAVEAEEKETSTGGQMIKVKFEVTKGEHTGRWIWMNFNVVNKSATAQKIGREQLKAWSTAVGKPDADDTDKLIDKPCRATVFTQKGTGGYKDSNSIKAFLFEAAEKPAAKAASKLAAKAEAKVEPKAETPSGKTDNPWD